MAKWSGFSQTLRKGYRVPSMPNSRRSWKENRPGKNNGKLMSSATQTEIQAAPPPVETMSIKVDGVTVAVPKTMSDPLTGKAIPTTMIQACAVAKVEVPHYCYHPKLPVAGNCR